MDYSITTERLDLRPMENTDEESLLRLHTEDPDALRYISWRPTRIEQVRLMLHVQKKRFQRGQDVLWAIRRRDDKDFIGLLNLTKIEDGEGEVHFFIARPYWGQRIVPEALAAVLEFAREQLGHRGVRGYCAAEHERSVRIFKKAGFADLGVHPDPEDATQEIRRFALAF